MNFQQRVLSAIICAGSTRVLDMFRLKEVICQSNNSCIGILRHETLMPTGNGEAEGGANPQLSRNCDGNENRACHCYGYAAMGRPVSRES